MHTHAHRRRPVLHVKVPIAGVALKIALVNQGAADKRERSALAQHSAKLENSPFATMNAPLPKTTYSGDDRLRKLETRAEDRRAFENRRMARVRACATSI